MRWRRRAWLILRCPFLASVSPALPLVCDPVGMVPDFWDNAKEFSLGTTRLGGISLFCITSHFVPFSPSPSPRYGCYKQLRRQSTCAAGAAGSTHTHQGLRQCWEKSSSFTLGPTPRCSRVIFFSNFAHIVCLYYFFQNLPAHGSSLHPLQGRGMQLADLWGARIVPTLPSS